MFYIHKYKAKKANSQIIRCSCEKKNKKPTNYKSAGFLHLSKVFYYFEIISYAFLYISSRIQKRCHHCQQSKIYP